MITTECQGAAGQPIRMDLHLPEGEGPHSVVLVCHGFKGFRNWGFFPEISRRLATAGFAAINIDLSHNGVGAGENIADFVDLDLFEENRPSYELHDIEAVLENLENESLFPDASLRRSRFGLLGHSRGGAAVLTSAFGKKQQVAAVTTWASVDSLRWSEEARASVREKGHWEVLNGRTKQLMRVGRAAIEEPEDDPHHVLDVPMAAGSLGENLLIVHGSDDPAVPVQAAHRLHEATDKRARLLIVDGADHVFDCRHPFAGPTPRFEEAMAATIAHFEEKLR